MRKINWIFVFDEVIDWLRIFVAIYGINLIAPQNNIIMWGLLGFYFAIHRSNKNH